MRWKRINIIYRGYYSFRVSSIFLDPFLKINQKLVTLHKIDWRKRSRRMRPGASCAHNWPSNNGGKCVGEKFSRPSINSQRALPRILISPLCGDAKLFPMQLFVPFFKRHIFIVSILCFIFLQPRNLCTMVFEEFTYITFYPRFKCLSYRPGLHHRNVTYATTVVLNRLD